MPVNLDKMKREREVKAEGSPSAPAQSSGLKGALKAPADGSALKKRGGKVAETRRLLAEIKLWWLDGKPDHEIQELLTLDNGKPVGVTHYNELKRELYRQEEAEIQKKTTEEVYVEYTWLQRKNIQDLDTLINQLHGTNQYNALVGAVRARSDIVDKLLKTGQDMGIINKEPERKLHIHGHAVVNMSNTELRKVIVKETQGLARVVAKYGDRDMAGNAISGPVAPKFDIQGGQGLAIAGPGKAAAARASRQAVKRAKVIDIG